MTEIFGFSQEQKSHFEETEILTISKKVSREALMEGFQLYWQARGQESC